MNLLQDSVYKLYFKYFFPTMCAALSTSISGMISPNTSSRHIETTVELIGLSIELMAGKMSLASQAILVFFKTYSNAFAFRTGWGRCDIFRSSNRTNTIYIFRKECHNFFSSDIFPFLNTVNFFSV